MSIEKFTGQFKNEANGVTILINSTIEAIKDVEALGLYVYLCSKPDAWKIHYREIMRHFNIGKEKAYRLLNTLMDVNVLTRIEIREKGKFKEFLYMLYLRPVCAPTPFPDFPEAAKPEAVFQDAYITKNLKNKESITTSEQSSPTVATFSEITPVELVRVYEQELPDNPKVSYNPATGEIDPSIRRLVKPFKRYFEAKTGNKLTMDGFRAYLEGLKEDAPQIATGVFKKSGKRNGLATFLKWELCDNWLNDNLF